MNNEIPTTTAKELRGVLIRWAIVLGSIGVFALWASWRMAAAAGRAPARTSDADLIDKHVEPQIEHWTCTMHPEVRQPEPGDCPICGMKLVAKYVGSDEPGVKPSYDSHAQHSEVGAHKGSETNEKAWYRCTMPECGDQGSSDPNSRCPVCGMKRERVDTGGGDEGEAEITLSERARRLAEVETEAVEERLLFKKIRSVGRVGYDETRYKMVSAWIAGRIDNLFADFTGMTVSQGDHLVEIYSPELLSAQEEYLQSLRAAESGAPGQTDIARRSSAQVSTASRRKLELLGITDGQISEIEQSGQAQTHLIVYAPIGGTIVQKKAMEGMYVKTGDVLYTIADLTHLWLLLDMYESDLPWIRPFQDVIVTTRSLPGDTFTGQIVFVDPKLDPKTRTVQVRVHVANPELRLKPDMWVNASIDAWLTAGGRGAVPAPSGEYVCPMHPWETANAPGICPICEMDLVPVKELPQFTGPTFPEPLLSVPRSAVLQTGDRALVYVESDPGTYRAVDVIVGPLAIDDTGQEYYPILSGLPDGALVVTRGNFAIDSQMQLAGKPSLFANAGPAADHHGGHEMHESTRKARSATPTPDKAKQKVCPVMGNPIDTEVFTDYKGVRVYFCCPPCIDTFLANPAKYTPALPASIRAKLAGAATKEADND